MGLSSFALTDRVAIVTGAGQGIGRGIALGLAEAGADIVAAELEPSRAEQTAAEIRSRGRKALVVPADVRIASQVDNVVRRTLAEFGRIDVLVNNAGGLLGIVGPLLETKEEDWDRGITLNLKSVFLCCKAVGKVMAAQKKGVIINISSVAGMGAYTPAPHYGVAKAGVINLTQTLAMELAPLGIRVNAIAPGTVATALVEELFRTRPELREKRLKSIPMGRLGRPEDIAAAVVYLASDASDYVTGEVLAVKGGLPFVG
ncbi:MAG: 3-oxoacyl-ACP reductase family protein [Dehalococcoidia bacterium]|nr:3-oxoacyl-ACP reductase family protein [Dehalococcoidia bacterium]